MKQTALFPPSQSILFSLEKEMLKNGMAAPLIEAFKAFESLPQPRSSLTQLNAFSRAMKKDKGYGVTFGEREVRTLDSYFKDLRANPLSRAYETYESLAKQGAALKTFSTFFEALTKHKDYEFLYGEAEVRAIYWHLKANDLIEETKEKRSFTEATRARHGKQRSAQAAPRTVAR